MVTVHLEEQGKGGQYRQAVCGMLECNEPVLEWHGFMAYVTDWADCDMADWLLDEEDDPSPPCRQCAISADMELTAHLADLHLELKA